MRRFYCHKFKCRRNYFPILLEQTVLLFKKSKEAPAIVCSRIYPFIGSTFSLIPSYSTLASTNSGYDSADHTCQSHAISESLDNSINTAANAIMRDQHPQGYWQYRLEDGVYSTASHIITLNCIGEKIEPESKEKMIRYIKRIQLKDGGWALAPGEPMDLNHSVLAYLALKLLGESQNEQQMVKACKAIALDTRICSLDVTFRLALCGIQPWGSLPTMPVEFMLLPSWFPTSMYKLASWARFTYVPMLVIRTLEPQPPTNCVTLDELKLKSHTYSKCGHQQNWGWFIFFSVIDKITRLIYPLIKRHGVKFREMAITRAIKFVEERTNDHGYSGVGASAEFALIMFHSLRIHENLWGKKLRTGLDTLVSVTDEETSVDPCHSQVWDTCWSALCLLEASKPETIASITKAAEWLKTKQVFTNGDWSQTRPNLRAGGWPFQIDNPFYPDVDDTAVVTILFQLIASLYKTSTYDHSIQRAKEWIIGMETKGGGWGAFDADNTNYYLNSLPLVGHVPVLDPPTVDVTARCLSMLTCVGDSSSTTKEVKRRAISFILKHQEFNGSWYGRWGVNYIYGTWSALCALKTAGLNNNEPSVQRGVRWILSIQNQDGGWGESTLSYNLDNPGYVKAESTASQTSWALLGLMACDKIDHKATLNGINYLLRTQQNDGCWNELAYTGTGHPGVMFLRYDGIKYFPLIPIARYRNMKLGKICVSTGL